MTSNKKRMIYFSSGEDSPQRFNTGGDYLEFTPKGIFIHTFKKRLGDALAKLERVLGFRLKKLKND